MVVARFGGNLFVRSIVQRDVTVAGLCLIFAEFVQLGSCAERETAELEDCNNQKEQLHCRQIDPMGLVLYTCYSTGWRGEL